MQELDLGAEQQMVLELRPAHNPTRAYGFAGVVVSLKDLSSSVWLWYRDTTKKRHGSDGQWAIKKVIEIPAQPMDPAKLPPLLQGFKAVPPLVTDIELSVDDRYLYVSCWGLGEFIQYRRDGSVQPEEGEPRSSSAAWSIELRTRATRASRSTADRRWSKSAATADGSISRTASTRRGTDRSIPTAFEGWIAKADIPANGGPMKLDTNFFIETGGLRPHQIRLEGGDASSDSYCYA